MYRMLGLFVYAILFSELFENAKKCFIWKLFDFMRET